MLASTANLRADRVSGSQGVVVTRGHACLSAWFHVRYFQTRPLIPFANYGLGFGEPASSSADSERGFLPTAEGLMAPSMTAGSRQVTRRGASWSLDSSRRTHARLDQQIGRL